LLTVFIAASMIPQAQDKQMPDQYLKTKV